MNREQAMWLTKVDNLLDLVTDERSQFEYDDILGRVSLLKRIQDLSTALLKEHESL